MPTKNKALAQATLDAIEKDLEHWNQSDWSWVPGGNICNTTHCFAGYAALQAGAKFSAKGFLAGKNNGWRTKSGHRIEFISEFAARKLGLTPAEADSIFFYIHNYDVEPSRPVTFEDLKQRVSEVFGL